MNTPSLEDSEEQAIYLEHDQQISQSPLLPLLWMPANNQAWIPHQQDHEMKQEQDCPNQLYQEHNQLYRTCQSDEHMPHYQYQALFENLNKEHMKHFNHPLVKTQPQRRRTRNSRSKTTLARNQNQNLKRIAMHIKGLIANNPNLTVKALSYVLFQIMSNTRLGLQIMDEGSPVLEPSLIETLTEKYRYDHFDDQQLCYIIKNTRRRLYDAINVMVAACVIQKSTSSILRLSFAQRNMMKKQTPKDDYGTLLDNMQEISKRVQAKREMLLDLQKRKMMADQLVSRNLMQWQISSIYFQLPLMVIVSKSKMLVEVETDKVSIISDSQFEILDDMECLEKIFKQKISNPPHLKPRVKK